RRSAQFALASGKAFSQSLKFLPPILRLGFFLSCDNLGWKHRSGGRSATLVDRKQLAAVLRINPFVASALLRVACLRISGGPASWMPWSLHLTTNWLSELCYMS